RLVQAFLGHLRDDPHDGDGRRWFEPTDASDCVCHGGDQLQGEPQVRSVCGVGCVRQELVACERNSVVVRQQLEEEARVCCLCECDQGSSFVAWRTFG
ncbi:unnamed protein product, partial [Aphanomyces euteiches]